MTVAGGKYLTDDVYLEIIGGGREGPAAQVSRVRSSVAASRRPVWSAREFFSRASLRRTLPME
jgi:hypothetical protein